MSNHGPSSASERAIVRCHLRHVEVVPLQLRGLKCIVPDWALCVTSKRFVDNVDACLAPVVKSKLLVLSVAMSGIPSCVMIGTAPWVCAYVIRDCCSTMGGHCCCWRMQSTWSGRAVGQWMCDAALTLLGSDMCP